jgi:hypothetical protein
MLIRLRLRARDSRSGPVGEFCAATRLYRTKMDFKIPDQHDPPRAGNHQRGLLLGAGTCLAKMVPGTGGASILALDGQASRIFALLSVAYQGSVPVSIMETLRKASDFWSRGEKALAYLLLSFCRLPPLETNAQAFRLFAADALLEAGLSPRRLMEALDLDPAQLDFLQNTIRTSRAFRLAMGVKMADGEMALARTRPLPRCPL